MAALAQFVKDPDAVLDYVIDWSAWLGTDTISTSTFSVVDPGITLASQSNTTMTSTAWLSGGSIGVTYRVQCRIVTAGGRTDDRTLEIKVESR